MTRKIARPLLASLCALALGAPLAAQAQDVPKPSCQKPQYPGRLASEAQKRAFNKDVEGYAACIKKYVADQQKAADDYIKAANQAANDYNNAVKEWQSEIDANK